MSGEAIDRPRLTFQRLSPESVRLFHMLMGWRARDWADSPPPQHPPAAAAGETVKTQRKVRGRRLSQRWIHARQKRNVTVTQSVLGGGAVEVLGGGPPGWVSGRRSY